MNRTTKLLTSARSLIWLVVGLLWLFPTNGWAHSQSIQAQVSGQVLDPSGRPIEGVTVFVKETYLGTFTDQEGRYTLEVENPGSAILVFGYYGFKKTEVPVSNQSVINVTLEEDIASLEEVVVVGYGSVERKDLTGSVASVKAEDFVQGTAISPEDLMNGKVAGVQITTADGSPGGGVRVLVRGSTSVLGNNQPLYIVDGIPIGNGGLSQNGVTDQRVTTNPLSWLNPNDIASIDVLKGPSAQAIYGTRAAAGVVIITTKSGAAGRTIVEADIRVGVNSPAQRYDVLNAAEFNDLRAQNNLPDQDLGSANNWQDSILRSALSQVYSLGISGGNAQTNYYASANYTNEEGTVRSTGYEKLTGRLKVSHKAINDRLSISMNITQSSENYDNSQIYPNNGRNNVGSRSAPLLGQMIIYNPTAPAYNEDGTFNQIDPIGEFFVNPISIAEQPVDELQRESFLGNVQAGFEVFSGLTYGVNLSYNNTATNRGLYYPKDQAFPLGIAQGGEAWRRFQRNYNYLLETTLAYQKVLAEKNSINAVAGYSWQRFVGEGLQVNARNFLFDQNTFNDIGSSGSPELADFTSFKNANKIISAFVRVNYSFDDRYLLTATYRRDGSDRFGPENRWGDFPSLAVAWRISQEGFLSEANKLDELKLRVEYGTIGNTPNSTYLGFLAPTNNQYNDGTGTYINGVELTNFPNPDLRWESTTTLNAGVDFSFFNGRIAGSLDYYSRLTEDLLLSYNVPSPSVFNTVTDNVGSMRNTGVEAALNFVIVDRNKFMFELAANGAYNQNEILTLSNNIFNIEDYAIEYGGLFGAGFVGDNVFRVEENQPIHNIYTLEWAGFDENGNELFLDSLGNAVPLGDVEANGNPNKFVGAAVPTFTFSVTPTFRYGPLDLVVYLRGATGFKVINNTFLQYADLGQLSAGNNVLRAALETSDEQNIDNPPEFSTRWVENGDFLRIDNVVLGYTLDNLAVSWIDNLRIYVASRNLALFTNYSGLDPEVFSTARSSSIDVYGVDYLTYPRSRNFTIGLNVRFR